MFAVGLDNAKNPVNVGHAVRAVAAYRGQMVCVSGARIGAHPSVAVGKHDSVPIMNAPDVFDLIPRAFVPVAVELVAGAINLADYAHPRDAYYIFGAEDHTLGERVLARCRDIVYIPTAVCLNLSACVNTVLYDRFAKEHRNA